MKHDPAIDAYIDNAVDFAKPILNHWRQLIHKYCPDTDETVKWSFPHYDYKGDFIFVMAAYKSHCSFTFLKADLMADERLKANKDLKPIKRFLGKITKIEDLPADEEFISMLKEAMLLNENSVKIKREKTASEKIKTLEPPDYLLAALEVNPKAKEFFEGKSNSFRKEYLIWITDAKTNETRQKRMNEALEWIAEGKGRFWKHQK